MILQALVKYYEELVQQGKAAKPGWCQAKVSHAIELNADGTIKTIISLKKEEQRGKKKVWVPEPLNVPEMVTRSSEIASNFLCRRNKSESYRLLSCGKGKALSNSWRGRGRNGESNLSLL